MRLTKTCDYLRFLGSIGFAVTLLGTAQVGHADEVLVGHLSPVPVESIKAAVPHSIKLSAKKPASILKEPMYHGSPLYGSITLGSAAQSRVTIVLDTYAGDKLPVLYVDIAGNGSITEKQDFHPLRPLSEFGDDGSRRVATPSTSTSGKGSVPIGALIPLTAKYGTGNDIKIVNCPVLFTLLGDELDYSIGVQRVGTINASGKQFKISLVDLSAGEVFNNYVHADDKQPVVKLLIDKNDDGKFDPRRESFDLAKPFRFNGVVYEVSSVDAAGTIIAFRPSDGRPEGAISADELTVGADAIDFSATMTDGKTVHFPTDFKHRVVLLSFWATTNEKSTSEMTSLVNVYNQYANDGFSILGVSLDKPNQLQTVLDFCQQAGMVWPEIYDGGSWNSAVAKLYGVDSLPKKFLIDGDSGTILALNDALTADGLQRAVHAALLKKHLIRQ